MQHYERWRAQVGSGSWGGDAGDVHRGHTAFKQSIMLASMAEMLQNYGTSVSMTGR